MCCDVAPPWGALLMGVVRTTAGGLAIILKEYVLLDVQKVANERRGCKFVVRLEIRGAERLGLERLFSKRGHHGESPKN
jgi:hypothetical protein